MHNRSIIISGLKGLDDGADFLKDKFKEFLEDDDRNLVDAIHCRKNNLLVAVCTDWKYCKQLADKYSRKKFLDKTINISLFSETDPKAK